MEKNLQRLRTLINEEADRNDSLDRPTKKSKAIEECDVEMFSVRSFMKKKEYEALLMFYKKDLSLKKLKTIFKDKEHGVEANRLFLLTMKEFFESCNNENM